MSLKVEPFQSHLKIEGKMAKNGIETLKKKIREYAKTELTIDYRFLDTSSRA